MTKEDVLNLIAFEIAKFGNRKAFAEQFEFTPDYINKILRGEREIPHEILNYLRIEEIKTKKYRRIKNA